MPSEGSYLDPFPMEAEYLVWAIFRKINAPDQVFPSYSAWKTQVRTSCSVEPVQKTAVTYLPPIPAKVTDFSTINQYLLYMQKLAEEVNMPYVSVTLDVGAAVDAYKLCWNYPERLKNVVIHLGDFHFLKENFNVIGKIVEGSGFHDTAFQAGVCSSGSLNGVLSGSHYNRSWLVHSTFSEALERLLYDRFLKEYKPNIPDLIQLAANDPNSDHNDIVTEVSSHIDEYKEFQQRIRNGEFGKTPMFWLCLYLDLMHVQHLVHLSIQENNFEVRLKCWQYFMPFYFALNKTNYSRYGSHYVNLLENIEQIYPGLKELLRYKGLSVQAQDRYKLRKQLIKGESNLLIEMLRLQVELRVLLLITPLYSNGH